MRVRLVVPTIALLIALLGASIAAADTALPMPSLVGAMSVPVPLPFLTPLIVVAAVLIGLDRAGRRLEATSTRVTRWDVAYLAGLFGLGGLIVVAAELLGDRGMGVAFLRNTAGCLGLALVVRRYLGAPFAGVVPVVLVLFCAAVGLDELRRPQPWAWPLADADSLGAALFCAGLCAAGIHGFSRTPRAARHK